MTYYGEVAFADTLVPTSTLTGVSDAECCSNSSSSGQFTYTIAERECKYYDSSLAFSNYTVPAAGSWSAGYVPEAAPKKGAGIAVTFFICLFVVGFASSWGYVQTRVP